MLTSAVLAYAIALGVDAAITFTFERRAFAEVARGGLLSALYNTWAGLIFALVVTLLVVVEAVANTTSELGTIAIAQGYLHGVLSLWLYGAVFATAWTRVRPRIELYLKRRAGE